MVRVGVVLAFVGILFPAWPASACIAPGADLVGIPADGDSGVPTDVVAVYEDLPDATLELTTDAGEPVAFTVRATYVSHFELVPAAPLAPRTTHLLRATLVASTDIAPTELVLSFTTGDGPLADPTAAPHPRLQHYSGPDFPAICGPGATGSCLSFGVGSVLDLALLDSSGVEQEPHYLLKGPALWSLPGDDGQGVPGCMTVRARGENGARSEPVTVCGDEAESYEFPDVSRIRCEANGLAIDGVSVGGDTSGSDGSGGASEDSPPDDAGQPGSHTIITKGCGCALPGHAAGAESAWWLFLGLAALGRRRRRRAARSIGAR